jgi:hypothetical protein
MVFHRSLGDEQGLGDLPVGLPACCKLRDLQFAGVSASRPRVASRRGRPAATTSSRRALAAKREAAHRVGQVQAFTQDLGCPGAGSGPAVCRSEIDERAG